MGDVIKGNLTRLKHWPNEITPVFNVWRDYYTAELSEFFVSVGDSSPDLQNCMYAWKTGQSRQRTPCDFTDQVNCACQYNHQLPQLRVLGLCAQKSKSEKQLNSLKETKYF